MSASTLCTCSAAVSRLYVPKIMKINAADWESADCMCHSRGAGVQAPPARQQLGHSRPCLLRTPLAIPMTALDMPVDPNHTHDFQKYLYQLIRIAPRLQ
jgi:hypothetical protein